MMFIVCCCYDRKLDAFVMETMFPALTPGAACRTFVDVLTRGQDTQIAKHPEDFFLAQLGAVNEETGEFVGMGARNYMILMEAVEAVPTKMSPDEYEAMKAEVAASNAAADKAHAEDYPTTRGE